MCPPARCDAYLFHDALFCRRGDLVILFAGAAFDCLNAD